MCFQAAVAFKAMLKSRGVLSSQRWAEVARFCAAFDEFKAVRSAGERKQAFAEFQQQSAKDDKHLKRLDGAPFARFARKTERVRDLVALSALRGGP